MAVKFEGTIPVDKYLDKIINVMFGTLSSRLIVTGLGFLTFGFWDVIVFGWETKVLNRDVAPPGEDMGWSEWLGLALLVLGIAMSVTKSIISFFVSRADDLAEQKIKLLEGYHLLSPVRLQHELWKVYKIRNADTDVSKRVLDHPTNKMGVMDLFKKCHLDVECNDNNWICLKGWAFKHRFWAGFLFFIAILFLLGSTLILASLEYAAPGISSSGPYAYEAFLGLSLLILISNCYIFSDLTKMGTAINLVENYTP
ncbi:hypothetical protein [Colwellia psychrerythraea]|uniref:Uncharacterized protein n=1 Tax=Colwellia psychrerythraea TaxID=28229 RepID=A0A099KA86_COLPS|nr:hypothetical protein [Colwellia psychrerythraea]KGJ86997.1 hypothetical protein ND2E_0404 [Colwellia psychrerythraea]